MPRAPLPKSLPGLFFVLEFDRLRGKFILHVDDEEENSYDLSGDVPMMMRQFELWGLGRLGTLSIDIAKEFGAVQTIPTQARTIPLYDKAAFQKPVLKFGDEGEETNHARTLPRLRPSL